MNRIKELRVQKGIQQQEAAKELNIPVSTYAGYERNEREPKLATWQKLADYFGVSVGYVQGITGDFLYDFANNNRIKEIRTEKKLSIEELSDITDIPANTLKQYENGERVPSQDNIYILSDVLKVSKDYLTGRTAKKVDSSVRIRSFFSEFLDDTSSESEKKQRTKELKQAIKKLGVIITENNNGRISISFPESSISEEQLNYLLKVATTFINDNNDND